MKTVKTSELIAVKCDFLKELFTNSTYPWEIIAKIKDYIKELITRGIDGYRLIGKDVLIGEGVSIHESAVIHGPAIIGHRTEVRPGAYIRGSVIIGEECVIGNSTEIKNSVLLNNVAVPHYNYVGDSILGNHAHLGAGAICSNLKSDKTNVVIHADEDINTGRRKLGAILGDYAEIGCGCVLNPGTIVGKNTSAYPLTALRGVYPSDSIIKDTRTAVRKR